MWSKNAQNAPVCITKISVSGFRKLSNQPSWISYLYIGSCTGMETEMGRLTTAVASAVDGLGARLHPVAGLRTQVALHWAIRSRAFMSRCSRAGSLRARPGRAAIKRPSRQIVITRRASESLSTAATAAAAATGVTREPEAEEGGSCPGRRGRGGAKQPRRQYFITNENKSEYDKLCRASQK